MKLYQLFRNPRLLTLLCSSLLVSCGDPLTTAGIGGTGISYGTVTDFGSIIINGRYLDDLSATVTLDDIEGIGDHGGLKQGMVVKVNGIFSGNTGTATSIEYRDNLEGPVCDAPESVNGIRTLRVLGQTVILDATTIVDNGATIKLGAIVEISGLPDELEQIHASFIEVKNLADAVIEVKGHIDTVVGSIFTINDLNVDFTDAVTPNGLPAIGQFVEVKGMTYTCGSSSTDTFIATSVELEPEGVGSIPSGSHAEVEGFITELTSNGFKNGNQEVVTTSSTSYLPEGFLVGDIMVGIKVEAEGTFDNGVLNATKIVFSENVRLESDVATVTGSSFTLVGLPDIIITINSVTKPLGVTVALGDHIRVRGIEGPNNTVLATRIVDKFGQTDAFLQGAVDTKEGTEITILGITVYTGLIPDNFPSPDPNFEDVNDLGISRATFLDLVQPGTLVKFKGDLENSVPIIWDEAELEDD